MCSVDNAPEPVPKEGQVLCDVYTAYVCNHSQIHGQSTNEHHGLRFLQCSQLLRYTSNPRKIPACVLLYAPSHSVLLITLHRLPDPRPTDQPPLPFVGGAEFAGRISKDSPIPPNCPFKPGDRVFGSGEGAYAEKLATNWQQLFPIPKGMSYNEAAGLFVTWPTSYEALVGRAELKAGE